MDWHPILEWNTQCPFLLFLGFNSVFFILQTFSYSLSLSVFFLGLPSNLVRFLDPIPQAGYLSIAILLKNSVPVFYSLRYGLTCLITFNFCFCKG